MELLQVLMEHSRERTAQIIYTMKWSISSKASLLHMIVFFTHGCPMFFLFLADFVLFFNFDSAIQPDLEQDGSSEIFIVNKKLRSSVWKDYELTMLDDGTNKATCKHCKRAYVAGNRLDQVT
jgi:hypothetical protein